MSQKITGYDVGALLYCPANMHSTIVDSLKNERFARPFSLAFCLEDTIREEDVEKAEQDLYRTFTQISAALRERQFYLPLIFIRIRSPRQLRKLAAALSSPINSLIIFLFVPLLLPEPNLPVLYNIRSSRFCLNS